VVEMEDVRVQTEGIGEGSVHEPIVPPGDNELPGRSGWAMIGA